MKSKSTAYLLWFFLGIIGAHKFYLNKVGTGVLYFLTFGIFFIGWFIDLFTLGTQVDTHNALLMLRDSRNTNNNVNNIVVNVPTHTTHFNLTEQLIKISELKEKGILTEEEYNVQKTKLLNAP